MFPAMPQEHERSLGLWRAPGVRLVQVVPGFEVDPKRMLQNLELTKGLVLAWKP